MYQKFSRKHWDIFSLYIIPLFTIIFACADGWLTSNFSAISYTKDRQLLFLILGFLLAWFFNSYIWYLFKKTNYKGKLGISLLQAATLSLILAVLTPYLPGTQQAKIHFIFAFCSPLLLLLSILCFQVHLEGMNKDKFKRARFELTIIVLVSFILLILVGFVSSLLEIFVCISICFYLRETHKRIESE